MDILESYVFDKLSLYFVTENWQPQMVVTGKMGEF